MSRSELLKSSPVLPFGNQRTRVQGIKALHGGEKVQRSVEEDMAGVGPCDLRQVLSNVSLRQSDALISRSQASNNLQLLQSRKSQRQPNYSVCNTVASCWILRCCVMPYFTPPSTQTPNTTASVWCWKRTKDKDEEVGDRAHLSRSFA